MKQQCEMRKQRLKKATWKIHTIKKPIKALAGVAQ